MPAALSDFFSYGFILRALAVGTMVSLCAAILGVNLVLKRFSMIGDGLGHVGFGTLCIAVALGWSPLWFSVPVMVAAAVLLLRVSNTSRVKGDAAIAVISSSALAAGIITSSVTHGMSADVLNYMFGSILAMGMNDVWFSLILSAAVLVMFFVFYNVMFVTAFDEDFARASGCRTGICNTVTAVLTAVTIVVGMRIMGAMLISSLIVFPALTSMRICRSFRSVVFCSAAVSVFCFFAGMLLSYILSIPAGASIIAVNLADLALFSILAKIAGK